MSALKALAASLAQHTLVRYIVVGGTSFAVELSALLLILHITGSRSLAAAIAFWIGFLVAFFLQKLVAFKEYSREKRAIARQGTLYIVLNIWNYLFTVAFVTIFPEKYVIASRVVALVCMASWNYVIYKKIIFKQTT